MTLKNLHGFMLPELLVALALSMLALAGLFHTQIQAQKISQLAAQQTNAAYLLSYARRFSLSVPLSELLGKTRTQTLSLNGNTVHFASTCHTPDRTSVGPNVYDCSVTIPEFYELKSKDSSTWHFERIALP